MKVRTIEIQVQPSAQGDKRNNTESCSWDTEANCQKNAVCQIYLFPDYFAILQIIFENNMNAIGEL